MDNNGFVKDTPWQTNGDSGLHEECGVFGMYDFDGGDVASTIYYGLFALQHRGQESCGIAVSETNGPKGKVTSYKGMGLVNEVFDSEKLEKLIFVGSMGEKTNLTISDLKTDVQLSPETFKFTAPKGADVIEVK